MAFLIANYFRSGAATRRVNASLENPVHKNAHLLLSYYTC
jgi:hypothetical protein